MASNPLRSRHRLFVGSASESLHVAEALHANLDSACEVTLWKNAFDLGQYALDELRRAAADHDFAAFVFTPDDVVVSRGEESGIPRDNVTFELGLFSYRLGHKRAWIVTPEGESVKIPTDLLGVGYATYNAPDAAPEDSRWDSALGPAAREIRRAMKRAEGEGLQTIGGGLPVSESGVEAMPPTDLLTMQVLTDAQKGLLPPVSEYKRGILVVHPLHGVGQVIGLDPPGTPDRMARIRFTAGVGEVPTAELFALRGLSGD